MSLKKNSYAAIKIETLLPFGSGQGVLDQTPVIVPNMLPGEEADIKIIKVDKGRGIGKLLELTTASPHRVDPTCSVAMQCGGCQLQHLDYAVQLKHKSKLLSDALGKTIPVEAADNPFHYRNKLQMSFGRDHDGRAILGLYATHSNRVVDTKTCHIVHPDIQAVLTDIRTWMKTADELPYHVVIRHSLATGDVMVIFSLGSKFKALQANIMTAFSGSSRITSLWLNLNDSPETSVLSDTFLHLSGTETLSDSLDGISFPVSPQSFVQNNPVMTAKLYDYVRGILRHISAKTVWDLYCGIGTLTQVCAQEVTDIVGIEVIPQAVSDAQVSSKKNNISNIRFYCEDATEFVSNADNDESPDTVILDPPRRGCSSALLTTLADKKIAHIVYISCSPQSLGRDVQALIDMGYSVKSCVGFDCFPNTIHVESVTHLVLKK